ncbi:amidohydrolase [Flavobacteriaceae bacterium]|nr:amidohydrolase [Flavobacteriaceae bacterium]MDB4559807.1 amidohydrolase [Flavobacteriaceae bacterium]
MSKELNIVAIQANLIWGNPEKNRLYFEQVINKLTSNTNLVVLPEMFSTGFTMKPSSVSETMNGATVSWMINMAKTHNIGIIGSMVIQENNQYFNRAIFVHPSGSLEIYDKRHLFSLAGEDKQYTPGTNRIVIQFKGWRICPFICYDLRFPVWSRNTDNYDVLLFMANWPIPRIDAWDTLLKARAIENMSYCIGVNRIGEDENGYQYNGHTYAYNFLGEKVASTAEGKEDVLHCEISKTKLDEFRQKLNFLKDQDSFKIQK